MPVTKKKHSFQYLAFNRTKYVIVLICILGINTNIYAQKVTYRIQVKDSLTKKNISNVSYSLFTKDKIVLIGKADTNGVIQCITAPNDGLYLKISSIGYNPVTTLLKTLDVILFMSSSSILLNEVILKDVRNLQFKPGKITLNVSTDLTATSNNVLELLRNMPMISVNTSEGTIYYKGKSGVTILLDGKSINGDLLKTLKPSSIKQIQLLSTSSAKYSSESKNGIINLVTANKESNGYDLSVDGILGNRQRVYLSPSVVIQQGKLNSMLNLGYDKRSLFSYQANNLNYQYSSVTDRQQITNNQTYKSLYFVNSYRFTDRNILSTVLNYYEYDFKKGIEDQYSRITKTASGLNSLNYFNNNQSSKSGLDVTLDYIYKFSNKQNGVLTLSSQLSNAYNTQNTFISSFDSGAILKSHNRPVDKENTFQLNYERPITNVLSFETGGKYIIRKNNSTYTSTSFLNNKDFFDLQNQNGTFSYTQNILGIFMQGSLNLKNYSFEAGIRYEGYRYNNDQQIVFNNSSLYPNINITKKFNKSYFISLDYSRKIKRPGATYLTTFIDQSSLNNNIQGNNYLKYEFLNNLSLNTNLPIKIIPLYLSIDYNFYNNSIFGYSYDLNTNNTESVYTTFINLTHRSDLGLSLNARLIGVKGIKSNLNFSFTRSFFAFNDIKRTGNEFLISESNVFDLKKGFVLNGSTTVKSKSITLQGYGSGFTITSISFSKHFDKPDFLIGVGVDNLFNIGQQVSSLTSGQNFYNLINSKTLRDVYYIKMSYSLSKNTVSPTHRIKISNSDLIK